jgi:serine/threonine protein kinase
MKDIDHRADMYSLGITLYEMFTGERPFHADSSSRLFVKHATVIPSSPQEIRPDLSAASANLVLRLLKKDPKNRFETYDQLIESIDAALK